MSLASLGNTMSHPHTKLPSDFESDKIPLIQTDYNNTELRTRFHPERSFKMPRSKSRNQVPTTSAMASYLDPGSNELSRSKSFHNKLNGYNDDNNQQDDTYYQQRRPSIQVDYIQNRRPSYHQQQPNIFQNLPSNDDDNRDDDREDGYENDLNDGYNDDRNGGYQDDINHGEEDDIGEEESEMYRRRLSRPSQLQFPSAENNNRRSASFRHKNKQTQGNHYHYQRRSSAVEGGSGGRKGSIPTIAYYPSDSDYQQPRVKTPEFADQFDMYLYQSQHITTPIVSPSPTPQLLVEVASDSDNSRRPSRASGVSSNYQPVSPGASMGAMDVPSERYFQGRRNSYCCSGDTLNAERRPSRTSNHSIHNLGNTPSLLDVPRSRSRGSSLPESLASEELYRLRNFSLNGKKVTNKGDVYKTRSNTSINSLGSSVENIENPSHHSSMHSSNGTHSQRSGSYLSRSGIATPVISRGSSCANLSDNSANSTNQNIYRVLMVGSSGVGKTALCSQFVSSDDKPNAYLKIVSDSVEKEVSLAVNGQERRLLFIDHPHGELSIEDMMTRYLPHCVLVVLGVDDFNSLLTAESMLDYIKNTWSQSNELAVILVANKSDLVRNRIVRTSEGKNLALKYNVKYIETSPGINHNVDEVLVGVYKQIALREEHHHSSNKMNNLLTKMSEWGLPVPNMRAKSCSNLTTI